MAKRTQHFPPPERIPHLMMTRAEASRRLKERAALGQELTERTLDAGPNIVQSAYDGWHKYNLQMLRGMLSNSEFSSEYTHVSFQGQMQVGWQDSLGGELSDQIARIAAEVQCLEHIESRLELYAETVSSAVPVSSVDREAPAPATSRKVFIVHGHDTAARHELESLLRKLDFNPIVLADQPAKGRTIIEKFEQHGSEAVYAVVLLTPDDEGREAGAATALKPRARQNVVLELGYFAGKLGRAHVCVLHKSNVELPSDYDGVVWHPLDEYGGWHMKLVKEIEAVGIEVDRSKL